MDTVKGVLGVLVIALLLLAAAVTGYQYVTRPDPTPMAQPPVGHMPTPMGTLSAMSSAEDYYRGFVISCLYAKDGDMNFCASLTAGAWQRSLHATIVNWWPAFWKDLQEQSVFTPMPEPTGGAK